MTDPRGYIAPTLLAAGLACLAIGYLVGKPAHGAEITLLPPPTGWQVQHTDGTPWRSPRGYTTMSSSETACGLALVEAVRFVPSGTRLQCRKVK